MEFDAHKNSENDNKNKQITIKGDLINIEEPLNINVIIEKDLEQAISGYGSTVSNPESITKGTCKKEFKEELEASFENDSHVNAEQVILGKAIIAKVKSEEESQISDELPFGNTKTESQDSDDDMFSVVFDEKELESRSNDLYHSNPGINQSNMEIMKNKIDDQHLQDNGYSLRSKKPIQHKIHKPRDKALKCEICKKPFTAKCKLQIHTKKVHGIQKNANSSCNCKNCTKIKKTGSENGGALVDSDKQFKCDLCKETFQDSVNVRHHIKVSHVSQKNSNCEFCGKISEMIALNVTHIKEVHGEERPYKCDFCIKRCFRAQNLREHIEIKHFKLYRKQKSVNAQRTAVLDHHKSKDLDKKTLKAKNSHHSNIKQNCVSQKIIPTELEKHPSVPDPAKEQEIHSKVNHKNLSITESYTYFCQKCKLTFNGNDNAIANHLKKYHIFAKSARCKLCVKEFKTAEENRMHFKIVHKQERLLECDFCEKRFQSIMHFSEHIFTSHFRVFKVKCSKCNRLFHTKEHLQIHLFMDHKGHPIARNESNNINPVLKSISEENPITITHHCKICNKDVQVQDLKSHLLTVHIQPQHFQCQLCDKVFPNVLKNKQHLQEFHGNDRLYKCELCSLNFYSGQSLLTHYQTIHFKNDSKQITNSLNPEIQALKEEKKPVKKIIEKAKNSKEFKCNSCNKSFDKKVDWRQHLTIVHKKTKHLDKSHKEPESGDKLKIDLRSESKQIPNSFDPENQAPKEEKKLVKKKTAQSKNSKEFQCNSCKKSFDKKVDWRKHLTIVHKKTKHLDKYNKEPKLWDKLKVDFRSDSKQIPNSLDPENQALKEEKKHVKKIIAKSKKSKKFQSNSCNKSFDKEVHKKSRSLDETQKEPKSEDKLNSLKNVQPVKISILKKEAKKDDQNDITKNTPVTFEDDKVNTKTTSISIIKCDLCTRTFNDQENLKKHKMKMHFEYVFKCGICKEDKSFSQKAKFMEHLAEAHKRNVKGKASAPKKAEPIKINQDALQNDLDSDQKSNQIHSPSTKNHKCESCEESFVSQKELAVHVIGVHL